MPRKEKKTREEKLAEDYFPVDEDDLKYTTVKNVKEPATEKTERLTVEKEYKS